MKARNPRSVDKDTDRAAFHAVWESAWPALLRRCAYLAHGDPDAANDLASEVAHTLCAQHRRGALRCRDLAALACRLAHLRAIGAWRTKADHDRRLRRLHAHIAMRNGRKVGANHGPACAGEGDDEPVDPMDHGDDL